MKKSLFTCFIAMVLFSQTAFASSPDAHLPAEKTIKIAIIDTGISTTAISSEYLESGYNYIEENLDTEDLIGHGTAIAGIIVEDLYSQESGDSYPVKLLPLIYHTKDKENKVVQGHQETIARAIREAIDLYGCRVINISTGTTLDHPLLREAVDYAEEKNCILVSSVGNSHMENLDALHYPAAYLSVIGVGSVNQKGKVSNFSQRNESVKLLAPGEKIWTLSREGYPLLTNGTSYATAFVSSSAAKLLVTQPDLTAAEVRHILYGSASDIEATGYDPDSGWGILQIETALDWVSKERRFRDIASGSWYASSIHFALQRGLLSGLTPVTFSPDSPMSRAMLWTVLWRMDGHKTSSPGDPWYSHAQNWTLSKSLTDGTNPEGQITREDLAVTLWRYAGSPISNSDLSTFSDSHKIKDYALIAMSWAVDKGILSGMGDGTLAPEATATRAQVAKIMKNYLLLASF